MPIEHAVLTSRISQADFKELSHEVMRHVFAIHNEFGRFFDEVVYKKELADRMSGVVLESEIRLRHGTFGKSYFIDVLVNGSGLFEFKASDAIHARHRGQTLNYLLLADLAHGKVINIRPESVQHEFVNCPSRLAGLKAPAVHDSDWKTSVPGADAVRDLVAALISDWGAGLETSLYEEALVHFLGGESQVWQAIPVMGTKGHLADQRMKIAAPQVAFKITALQSRLPEFELQARKLIQHTTLQAIHWINLTQNTIHYTTLT